MLTAFLLFLSSLFDLTNRPNHTGIEMVTSSFIILFKFVQHFQPLFMYFGNLLLLFCGYWFAIWLVVWFAYIKVEYKYEFECVCARTAVRTNTHMWSRIHTHTHTAEPLEFLMSHFSRRAVSHSLLCLSFYHYLFFSYLSQLTYSI